MVVDVKCSVAIIVSFLPILLSATNDRISQCVLSGNHKTRQSILLSPNYPENYPPNTCWDYVVRSPYRCPTKFHIQFLDFHLESSQNCSKDYLAMGLHHDDTAIDVLCGQVSGIKKYETPDGVLRLRFFSDDSPWTTDKGFKLLVTRLACEREDMLRDNLSPSAEDTVQVEAPAKNILPPFQQPVNVFQNLTSSDRHVAYPTTPLSGLNFLQQQVPVSATPANFEIYTPQAVATQGLQNSNNQLQQPCIIPRPGVTHLPQGYLRSEVYDWPSYQQQLQHVGVQQLANEFTSTQSQNQLRTAPIASNTGVQTRQQIIHQVLPSTAERCCVSDFNQKHLYLSSPGFPRTAFTSLLSTQQRDCYFEFEKYVQSVCRLRVEFKFFDFGQTFSGTPSLRQGNIQVAIGTSKDLCNEDFIEIDGERFCGCRTNSVYTTYWGLKRKTIRMRIGYSEIPSSGFLLDIFQEECQGTQFLTQPNPVGDFGQTAGYVPQNNFAAGLINPAYNNYNSLMPSSTLFPFQQGLVPSQQQFPVYPAPQPQLLPFQLQQQHQQQLQQQLQTQLQSQRQLPLAPMPMTNYYSPQFRSTRQLEYAKARSLDQPYSVIETNSTRKEFFYFDGEEAFAQARQSANTNNDNFKLGSADESDISEHSIDTAQLQASLRRRCNFDGMDALRLSVDYYWITKPTCYSPQGRWFTHLFG